MNINTVIRQSGAEDIDPILSLYPSAFPEEDLVPLVHSLLKETAIALSLVADVSGEIVGHILFSRCQISGTRETAALLAPLAVAPEYQRQGVGGALIEAGLDAMREEGVARVFVLGDPAYYSRMGFVPDRRITPPYPLPDEWATAWQSIALKEGGAAVEGELLVPQAWRDAALWGP